jgi:HD-GYP domain-containing protein (c-di-GMP phosphodiesterase class II)
MIKKVKAEQLKPGMFVQDFNCGWLNHPFLHNRVLLKGAADIEKVIEHRIREVYIDTDLGLDADDAPTEEFVDEGIQTEINKLEPEKRRTGGSVSLGEEIGKARLLLGESKQQTEILMDAVRMGRKLDLPQVAIVVEKMTESVLRNKDALVSLTRIKNKDEYTYLHSLSVAALCISFGQHLGLESGQIKALGIGGLLHDIGKVRMPLGVLNKPGPLTEKEFESMKTHVAHGNRILQDTTGVDEFSICVCHHHHERLDGTGYPDGLKGDEISKFGQIAAIVDIYDALTSERCYKDAMPPTDALKKLFEWSESYLNRSLVEQFIIHMGIYPVGTLVRLRSGFIGVVVGQGERSLLDPVVRAVFDTKRDKLVTPFLINLSSRPAGQRLDEIIGCETPDSWNFQPQNYLAA